MSRSVPIAVVTTVSIDSIRSQTQQNSILPMQRRWHGSSHLLSLVAQPVSAIYQLVVDGEGMISSSSCAVPSFVVCGLLSVASYNPNQLVPLACFPQSGTAYWYYSSVSTRNLPKNQSSPPWLAHFASSPTTRLEWTNLVPKTHLKLHHQLVPSRYPEILQIRILDWLTIVPLRKVCQVENPSSRCYDDYPSPNRPRCSCCGLAYYCELYVA